MPIYNVGMYIFCDTTIEAADDQEAAQIANTILIKGELKAEGKNITACDWWVSDAMDIQLTNADGVEIDF